MITKLEIKRQILHIFIGVVIVLLVYNGLVNYAIVLGGALLMFIIAFLISKGIKIPVVSLLFKNLERTNERTGMRAKGAIFYLLGSGLALLLFPRDIAMAAILILAFGDSFSRLVGPYGYLQHPFNSLRFIEGIIAGGVAATIAALLFVPFVHAILASTVSMFLESLDIEINKFKIDDNFTIPLVAGLVIMVIDKLILFV